MPRTRTSTRSATPVRYLIVRDNQILYRCDTRGEVLAFLLAFGQKHSCEVLRVKAVAP